MNRTRPVPGHSVQLKTREFHHKDVETHRITNRVEHRHTDIAAGCHPHAVRREQVRGQAHRRCLAVGSGHNNPLRRLYLVPHTAICFPPAHTSAGGSGQTPGNTMISSGAKPRRAAGIESSGSDTTDTPTTSRIIARSSVPVAGATTSTSAPSSASVSATEHPVTPSPTTATRRPDQSLCQLFSELSRAIGSFPSPPGPRAVESGSG